MLQNIAVNQVSVLSLQLRLTHICFILFNIGNGKTHYIRKCLERFPEDHKLTVSINESFKVSTILQRMMSLNRDGEPCGLFFNFTFSLVCGYCTISTVILVV